MPDPDISLNTSPEDLYQNARATASTEAPVSITSALADYANRPQPPASSLGLLMNDQQMRDAGIYPDVSIIDATGAGDPKADPAGGYAKVATVTKSAVNAAHNAASWLGRAPIISNALKAGQTVKSALAEAASHPSVAGLKTVNTAFSVPLSAAEGVARTATDVRNGASLPDAIVGNIARTGLVAGAGMIPYVGWAAAPAANRFLPDGAVMGHGINQSLGDPDRMGAVLEEGF